MENEMHLIDANKLMVCHINVGTVMFPKMEAFVRAEDIKAAPIVDAVEVVHARWIPVEYKRSCTCNKASNTYTEYLYRCSACNRVAYKQPYGLNYCPNCGAKMDGGNEDENS